MWQVLLCVCASLATTVAANLSVQPVECGRVLCKKWEYCSKFETQCKPCAVVCNRTSHNFDPSRCKEDCQDYLHDLVYVRKDGESSEGSLKDALARNERLVIVNQVLIAIIFIILITVAIFVGWRWKRNNDITFVSIKQKIMGKKSDGNTNKSEVNGDFNSTSGGKPDLRLNMPITPGTVMSDNLNSPATVSTVISRRPAEDSTLDYAAYDNPAMSTPSPNSRPHESSL